MSAFNTLCTYARDRNWGGTSVSVAAEPYISGFSFIRFIHIPVGLQNTMMELGTNWNATENQNHITVAAQNKKDVRNFLEASMNSVTPPGGTINKVEFQGLGGTKWSVPGSIDYQNSISIKYYEFSGLPIAKIHRSWCSLIRDNRMGLTHLNAGLGNGPNNVEYNKQNYAATLAYWTTKPDGVTVEFAAIYTGVFPTKDPMDLFTGDIQSIDKLEIEIEYNVDMIYNDDSVYQKCREWALLGRGGALPVGQTEWEGATGKWNEGARGAQEAGVKL